MSLIAQFCGFLVCAFIGLLGLTIIVWIWRGKIRLDGLVSEANGSASTSRFQLLVFSFLVAISLFGTVQLRANPAGFAEIPRSILVLLAISASTFIIGKGISFSQPGVTMHSDVEATSYRHRNELVPLYLFLALVGLLGFAVRQQELSGLKAALLALTGGLTIWFVTMFLHAVQTDGPPQVDTNWGGLGGSIGGWRCSASLVYLLCTFVLGAVVVAAFLNQSLALPKKENAGNAPATTPIGANEKKAEEKPSGSPRQKTLEVGPEIKPPQKDAQPPK